MDKNMNKLMRKTKHELIDLIQDMVVHPSRLKDCDDAPDADKQHLEATVSRMREENEAFHGQLSDMRTAVDRLRGERDEAKRVGAALQVDKQRLEAAMAGLKQEHTMLQERMRDAQKAFDRMSAEHGTAVGRAAVLQERIEIAARENDAAAAVRTGLEKALADARENLKVFQSRYRSHYELFRSFVDDDRKRILLLDTAYEVVYINRAARPILGLGADEKVDGKRFFDFMPFQDAIKVKEKIDRAFLEGETEKIKHVRLHGADGNVSEFKLKMSRVRHRDRPSVKIVVK